MKKIALLIFSAIAAFCLCACGARHTPAITESSELAGVWYGCGNALGKGSDYRADNLCLSINSDGSFILSDPEQGTDLLQGTASIGSKNTITITADSFSEAHYPHGWEALEQEGSLSYQAPDTEHLLLTCDDISYFFEKEDAATDRLTGTSVSPLLDIAETDIWYSSPDEANGGRTYELALYDSCAELSVLRPGGEKPAELITNFLYYENEGSDFTFYTWRDDSMDLPEIFGSLPEGISQVQMTLSAQDETLTMEYDGKVLPFYNNVIYGLDTSSAAYYLNNTCFNWDFDGTQHFCWFATDAGTGDLCLFLSDGKKEDPAANTICGQINVEESGRAILFHFDRSRSKLTADRDSALFKRFKALDQENDHALRIPFTLTASKLKLKTKKYFGRNYTFKLRAYTAPAE